jgi:hypothetical protein
MIKKFFLTSLVLLTLSLPQVSIARTSNDPKQMQWAFEDIKLNQAWDITTGREEVTVAVIDNGFDQLHPDLKANVWTNTDEISDNGKDDDNNGYVDDRHGWNFVTDRNNPRPDVEDVKLDEKKTVNHGTMVAGLLGAKGNNNIAGSGVNWNVGLMNLKVVDNDGKGNLNSFAEAVRYGVDNGAEVISISLVGQPVDNQQKQAIRDAIDYAYNNDVAVFSAAGNKSQNLNKNPFYPVCADNDSKQEQIIGVSSVNQNHQFSSFSNGGSDCIDITAPGVDMSSTLRYSPASGLNKMYGGGWDGTSFATPLVSGVAALIKSLKPDWGPKQIYQTLLDSTFSSKESQNKVYKTFFGSGLLQASGAVSSTFSKISPQTNLISGISSYSLINSKISSSKQFSTSSFSAPNLGSEIDEIEPIFESSMFDYLSLKSLTSSTRVKFIGDGIYQDWTLPAVNIKNFAVGNLREENSTTNLLVTVGQDQNKLKLFTEDKKLLAEKNFVGEILSVNFVDSLYQNYPALLIKKSDNFFLYKLDQKLNLEDKTQLSMLINTPRAITSGDIDGDKRPEFIFTMKSKATDSNLLSYIEQDGSLISEFYSYDLGKKFNTKLSVEDVDQDQQDEVLTIPKKGSSGKIKVWNNSGEVTQSWQETKLNQKIFFPQIN